MNYIEALQLIATGPRPDGTWDRDREACRQIAAEALGFHNNGASMTTTPEAPLSFAFVEFNERRAMRGAPAARVDVHDPGDPDSGGLLWMSRSDITKNIKAHGDCPALQQALAAYGAWK